MNEAENKKEYELSYLLTPDIPEDKIDSEATELKNIITENGGDTVQTNPPEKKRLAYPVRKQNQAYFGIVYFNINKDGLDKIKKTLAFSKKILRFLILSKVLKPKPSPVIVQQPAKTPVPTQSFDQKLESILKG
ncbi:MAG: 30S ribosomal protein S6 [Patescibacteria group bacterium]